MNFINLLIIENDLGTISLINKKFGETSSSSIAIYYTYVDTIDEANRLLKEQNNIHIILLSIHNLNLSTITQLIVENPKIPIMVLVDDMKEFDITYLRRGIQDFIRKDDIEENVGDVIRKIYYCVIRYQQNKETAEKWEKILDAIKKIDPAGRPPI